ncbi:MAG: hypothetical protein GXO54_07690 [Chloroflexi bacterium]|nr:hypothetical protein [Chloroflexota bacterium]
MRSATRLSPARPRAQWLDIGLQTLWLMLPLGLWLWMDLVTPHPYWLARGDSEQDMSYTARALFAGAAHDYRHPGTPVFYVHTGLYALLGGRFESIPAYLFWSHGLVALSRGMFAVAWWRWARRQVGRGMASLGLAVWFAHPTFLAFAELLNTDSYLPLLGLGFLSAAWAGFESPDERTALGLGLLAGFLLSTKFALAPLVASVGLVLGVALPTWVMRGRAWALYTLATATGFVVFATPPRFGITQAWQLLVHFLGRTDTRWYITRPQQFYYVWRRVLATHDIYWLVPAMAWVGLLIWAWVVRPPRAHSRARRARSALLGLLALAWLYTLGAQSKADAPYIEDAILSLGYRIRNTYPPTLGLALLPLWLGRQARPRRGFWAVFAGLWIGVGVAWGGFLLERGHTYRVLAALHDATQVMLETYTDEGRIAFWTMKGFPIVDEAAFHFEGNWPAGRGLFTAELIQRYPRYTLFLLRNIPEARAQYPPPAEWDGSACPQQRPRATVPLFEGQSLGVRPRWVAYWTWEAEELWHVTLREVLWALCAYGNPRVVAQPQVGRMQWVVIEMRYP